MNEEDKIKISGYLLDPSQLKGTWTSKNGDKFEYKFPTPNERADIERVIAQSIGVPVEQFNVSEYNVVRINCYLDAVITSHPDWWVSAGECMDPDIVNDIFLAFVKDQENFRRKLKSGQFPRASKKPST